MLTSSANVPGFAFSCYVVRSSTEATVQHCILSLQQRYVMSSQFMSACAEVCVSPARVCYACFCLVYTLVLMQ